MTSPAQAQRSYAAQVLSRYWPNNADTILRLPFPAAEDVREETLPPRMEWVELPEWGSKAGVGGKILVPASRIVPGSEPVWERTDWLGAAFWYFNGQAEREYERRYGPIHSYSFRLESWDENVWSHAWVNRIALFLRKSVAQLQKCDEDSRLGPLPKAEIILTHDVDAVTNTWAIGFKQSAFNLFNAVLFLFSGSPGEALRRTGKALQFFFSARGDYGQLYKVLGLESKRGLKARFHFYGGVGGCARTLKQMLMDPAYRIEDLGPDLRKMLAARIEIGLHPSFDAWEDADMIRSEREHLEEVAGEPVTFCRQHWFRFGWEKTWKAQQEAGLFLDSTLGFNDRPGFRNGAALRFQPWDADTQQPMRIEALPTIFMDSQFYDYKLFGEQERRNEMKRWIDEVREVGGVATVLWHPHTLGRDYGWGDGFEQLLDLLAEG